MKCPEGCLDQTYKQPQDMKYMFKIDDLIVRQCPICKTIASEWEDD